LQCQCEDGALCALCPAGSREVHCHRAECPGTLGLQCGGTAHEAGSRKGLEGGTGHLRGRRQHLRPVAHPLPAEFARSHTGTGAPAGTTLCGQQCRHQCGHPIHPHHQRHAGGLSTEFRGPGPRALQHQSSLSGTGAGQPAQGRDAGRAARGVRGLPRTARPGSSRGHQCPGPGREGHAPGRSLCQALQTVS